MQKDPLPLFQQGYTIDDLEVVNFYYRSGTGVNYYYCRCTKCNKNFIARENDIVNRIVTNCNHDIVHDLTTHNLYKGKQFDRLTVLDVDHIYYPHFPNKSKARTYVLCQCTCSNLCIARNDGLKSGAVASCGCKNDQVRSENSLTHGLSNTRFYRIWVNMLRRCDDPKTIGYPLYGGRGITYDPRWKVFENFRDDMYEDYLKRAAEVGDERLISIDRIDVNGNYCKENCQWATMHEQNINKNNTRKVMIVNKEYIVNEITSIAHPSLCLDTITGRIFNNNVDPIIAISLPPFFKLSHSDTREEREKIAKEHYCPISFIHKNVADRYVRELEELERNNPWKQKE